MTTERVVVDLETRSTLNLKKTNPYVYAKHPTTDVWMVRYAFTSTPTEVHEWRPGWPLPQDLIDHVNADLLVSAHNAEFEFAISWYILQTRYGWPPIFLHQLTDTAARAARCGIPRSLEHAVPAIGGAIEKDKVGHNLMMRMARPRRVEADGALVWWDDKERVDRLSEYCAVDVLAQMQLEKQLPVLPKKEWEIWQATLRANWRGMQLDVPFIDKALSAIDVRMQRYSRELKDITQHTASSPSDINGMKAFLHKETGSVLDSLDKNAVSALLEEGHLPPAAERVLHIRQESGKSSVSKFAAMRAHADNGITQGQLVYYGAQATGRWSGMGFQIHNLPARGALPYQDAEALVDLWLSSDMSTRTLVGEHIDFQEGLHGASIIEILSMCLRSAITSRPGHQVNCADYSNIEGRIAAWFGNEVWKLTAFREFDAGVGPDLYKVTAATILAKAIEAITKDERNIMGKVPELALGFQGGAGAFADMGRVYGVNMEDYFDPVRANLDPSYWEKALENWDTFGSTTATVTKSAWIPSEAIKVAWRARHPGLSDPRDGAWAQCESAAVKALRCPGTPVSACGGKLAFFAKEMFSRPFLLMRLPSGRCIYYAGATLRSQRTPWGAVKDQIMFSKVEKGRALRRSTYGGDIFQSAVQGSARDLMANAWLTVEKAGYIPLFSVHDEMVTERSLALPGDVHDFEALMAQLPEWARDIPVSAKGYVSSRFRKD